VLLVLGCIQQEPETNDKIITFNGLTIVSFSADITNLLPGETTDLELYIRNIGDFTADNIETKLIGLGEMTALMRGSPLTELEQADYDSFSWELTAPNIAGFTTEVPMTPQATVYYKYFSQAWSDVNIVPSSYSEQVTSANGTSSAPIDITITPSSTPLRTYRDNMPLNIHIDLTNRGGGGIAYFESGVENSAKANFVENIVIRFPSEWIITDDSWTLLGDNGAEKVYSLGCSSESIVPYICPSGYSKVGSSCIQCPSGYSYNVEVGCVLEVAIIDPEVFRIQ